MFTKLYVGHVIFGSYRI